MHEKLPFYRLSRASAKTGVPRNTIESAIDAGHIPHARTLCGLPLVRLADVREFKKNRPAVGPKPKKD